MRRAERVYFVEPRAEFSAHRHLMPTLHEIRDSVRKDVRGLLPPFLERVRLQNSPDLSSLPTVK